jgi:type IV secretory pathway ATPase VirB11/archaellum biosynthesis ATPase
MDKGTIDEAALVMLIENHWQEFVEYSGGEESAEMTLRALMKAAGMD